MKYENDEYEAAKKELPDYGKEIVTPDGKGKVIGLNLLSRIVKVRLFQRETPMEYHYDELKDFAAQQAAVSVTAPANEAKKAGDASEHGQT